MAASLTRALPRTINSLLSKRLGSLSVSCCCNNTGALFHHVTVDSRPQRRHDRQFFTYSQLRQSDMIKAEAGSGEQVTETVSDEEEPDVLYKKIVMEVKGHDPKVLQSYEKFVRLAAQHLDIKIGKISKPKYHVFRQSVLRSVFVHKKHYSQFEQRTHFVVFEIPKLTGSTADTFLEYTQRNLPEGVAMKVTRHRLEQFPEHLKPPTKTETQPST